MAGCLTVLGVLALRRALGQDARVVGPRIDIGRGAILLAIAVVIVLCLEDRSRRTSDGIEIMPYGDFVRRLWSGEIF